MKKPTQKIINVVSLAIVFIVPNHFRFKHQRRGNMNVAMFAFQWMGYVLSVAFTWVDMGQQYVDHLEGKEP